MPTATLSSYETPIDEDGLELPPAAPQSNEGPENTSRHFNEDQEDEDNAIFRSDHDAHEEHMVTQKEDSWVKTFAGVAGNVLEW